MNGFFAWLMGLVSIIPGFGHAGPATWNGYVEDDYVYASAASAGTITMQPTNHG